MPSAVLQRLAARDPAHYPLLLDSAAQGPLSDASVLLAQPQAALWLGADGRIGAEGHTPRGAGFLESLENWWRAEGAPDAGERGAVAFAGGWALFLSYELASELEPHLDLPRTPLPWKAFALRTPCALVHEVRTGRVLLVAEEGAEEPARRVEADARAAARERQAPGRLRIESVREEIGRAHV